MKKIIGMLIIVLVVIYGLPKIDWGKFKWLPGETVTVTGEAKVVQKNQIASFSAGVDAVNDKKDEAVKEVNSKMEALIKALKEFGIKENDIQTQSLNYYQNEESYWDNGVQKSRKGQWRVSNSIEIKLREVDKASQMADLLASSGANNVYGPNFQFDDTSEIEKQLFAAAIADAKDKGLIMAEASGRKLGKVLSVNEGSGTNNNWPILYSKGAEGGGGSPMEAGSGTVSQTVTVVFELQ
jgi:uncharacterized protein YggE